MEIRIPQLDFLKPLILKFRTVMAPEKPEDPERDGGAKQELANGQQFPASMASFQPHQPCPTQNQQPDDGNRVGQGHEETVELVPLLHTRDPVPATFPFHSVVSRFTSLTAKN